MSGGAHVTLKDGNLCIDLDHLLAWDGAETEVLYTELARQAAFQESFVRRLIDHIISGATEDGDWWTSEMAEAVRFELLPHINTAIAELIRQLVNDRDRAVEMRDRWRNACWQITDAWESMDRERMRKVKEPGYYVACTMTEEQAKAWLETKHAELDNTSEVEDRIIPGRVFDSSKKPG